MEKYQSDKDPIYTLHRYYIWATTMRATFQETLKAYNEGRLTKERFDIRGFMYLSAWYGLLYVVSEGWGELGLKSEKVEALLKSPNLDLLRRYRNGVFHFQKTYFDPRLTNVFDDKNTIPWAHALDDEFGKFFADYFRSKLN